MKKLVYLSIIIFLGVGCSHKGTSSKDNWDTVCIAPDSVWDYSGLPNYDSINQAVKAYSYDCYRDSNALENGLPDSIMKRKGDTPHKDTLWMLKEDTPYHKMPIEKEREEEECL